MGSAKKQSILHSSFNLIGLFIGVVNNIFIYPIYLSIEELGFVRAFSDIIILWSPFVMMGINQSAFKFFPAFSKVRKQTNQFFTFIILIQLGILLLLLIPHQFLWDNIKEFYQVKHPEFKHLIGYIPIAMAIITLKLLLTSFIFNYKKIAFQPLLDNILVKIGLASLAFVYFSSYISYNGVIKGLILLYLFITIVIFIYFMVVSGFRPSLDRIFLKKLDIKEFTSYSLYGTFNKLGSILSQRVDVFMLFSMSTASNIAIYTQSLFIANIMSIPMTSIFNITKPIIADAFQKDDFDSIKKLYKKTSTFLLSVGLLLYLCLITSVDHLFAVIPKGDIFIHGKYVIFIIGFMHVVDMSTSINQDIIGFSKHYRFNLYVLFIMAITNVSLNIILIPRVGITGAAIATGVSILVFNVIKLAFIKYKFKVLPFNPKDIYLVLIAIVTFIIVTLITRFVGIQDSILHNLLFLICINLLIFALYIIPVFYFKLSPDLNKFILDRLNKFI